jgi:hypothetical protein
MPIHISAVAGFQDRGGSGMEPGPRARRQLVVENLPDQLVPEAIARFAYPFFENVREHRFIQLFQKVAFLIFAPDRLQQFAINITPKDCSDSE